MKKLISAILTIAMMLSFNISASAAEPVQKLIPDPPYNDVERGSSAPDIFTVWNIEQKGQYDFEGFAEGYSDTALYTNYHFKGKTSYMVQINNTCGYDVEVLFRGWFTDYRTVTVPAYSTRNYQINTRTCDEEITADTIWYIRFSAPCEVNGYVK